MIHSFKRLMLAGLAYFGGVVISSHASALTPTVSHISWGIAPSGQPVALYTLSNSSGMEVRIATYGGTITSLKAPDKSGHLANVVLGFDNLARYTNADYLKAGP